MPKIHYRRILRGECECKWLVLASVCLMLPGGAGACADVEQPHLINQKRLLRFSIWGIRRVFLSVSTLPGYPFVCMVVSITCPVSSPYPYPFVCMVVSISLCLHGFQVSVTTEEEKTDCCRQFSGDFVLCEVIMDAYSFSYIFFLAQAVILTVKRSLK